MSHTVIHDLTYVVVCLPLLMSLLAKASKKGPLGKLRRRNSHDKDLKNTETAATLSSFSELREKLEEASPEIESELGAESRAPGQVRRAGG